MAFKLNAGSSMADSNIIPFPGLKQNKLDPDLPVQDQVDTTNEEPSESLWNQMIAPIELFGRQEVYGRRII